MIPAEAGSPELLTGPGIDTGRNTAVVDDVKLITYKQRRWSEWRPALQRPGNV